MFYAPSIVHNVPWKRCARDDWGSAVGICRGFTKFYTVPYALPLHTPWKGNMWDDWGLNIGAPPDSNQLSTSCSCPLKGMPASWIWFGVGGWLYEWIESKISFSLQDFMLALCFAYVPWKSGERVCCGAGVGASSSCMVLNDRFPLCLCTLKGMVSSRLWCGCGEWLWVL